VLDFIYYPVSFIMWCWHWVFGHVFGEANAIAWALSIVFLVFTLRAIMFKPMVKQVRSMRKMQEFAPEIKKLQKKYANDKQKLAQEMQKLQAKHGVSPLGGCLPMLLQIPVFIGLFHVLREFKPGKTENYFFDAQGVASYIDANLFGARLSNWITQPAVELAQFDVSRASVIAVSVPLMIIASVLTHLTARHSVARQNPEAATQQTAIMNKLTLYIFPLGVLVGGFFFPIGLLVYWLSNNSWTLMQQHVVYRQIDKEEAAAKAEAIAKKQAAAPKVGQKPQPGQKPRPGQKPVRPGAKPATAAKPAEAVEPAGEVSDASAAVVEPDTGADKPAANGRGGTQVPGLNPDRSRKSGRKNR
jgi:YidC/Oxa1 family membrane protein insertase